MPEIVHRLWPVLGSLAVVGAGLLAYAWAMKIIDICKQSSARHAATATAPIPSRAGRVAGFFREAGHE